MTAGWLSCWASPRPTAWLPPRARPLPFPLEDPRCRLYELGRHALWHGVRRLGLSPGDEVLVPAYHHGSEVGTLVDAGLHCRFYEAGDRLEPNEAELAEMLGPRTRALLIIHYLGFPQDAPRWRRWCDDRGLLLIEDAAMAWPAELAGRPVGSWGDMAIFSPWKTYGLPDCGALICERPPPAPARRARVNARALAIGHVKWLAQRWGWIARVRPPALDPAFDPAVEFSVSLGDLRAGTSSLSLYLLERSCRVDAASARRENHRRLVEILGDRIPPPFERAAPGACPFATPVETPDKHALLRHLAARGIAGLDLWSVPHPLLPLDLFPAAARRRARTVGLPVHQELRSGDIERIAEAVLDFEAMKPSRERHPIEGGDRAADFELLDHERRPVRLSGFAGRTVVLYFYPEADTPGCTAQACGIRDHHAELTGANAVVLGVSPDTPEKLRRFAGKYGLPFTLLSDADHEVARRYGVWVRRPGLLPRKENERTTFVIGPDGVVQRVFRAVDPAAHDRLVAAELVADHGDR